MYNLFQRPLPAERQDELVDALLKVLNDYVMLSQMYAFEGSDQDFQKLAQYSAYSMNRFCDLLISGAPILNEVGWNDFERARLEFSEKPSPQTKEKLIECVRFNLGEHKSALHTGAKWELVEDRKGFLHFEPSTSPSIKLSQMDDLRASFPFIEEVTLNPKGLWIKYNEEINDDTRPDPQEAP